MLSTRHYSQAPSLHEVIARALVSYTLLLVTATASGVLAQAYLPLLSWAFAFLLVGWGLFGVLTADQREVRSAGPSWKVFFRAGPVAYCIQFGLTVPTRWDAPYEVPALLSPERVEFGLR